MKKLILAACLITLSLLAACGSNEIEYKNDVPVTDIATKIDTVVDGDSLVAMQESYLKNAMHLDPAIFAEYVVKINSRGVNVDEYGIFKAPDADSVGAVKTAAEDYLKYRTESWMPEYMPEEFPKLENAKVKVFGQYVMYSILSDDQRDGAFTEFEAALKP